MSLCEEFGWPFIGLNGACGVVEDSAAVLDWRFVVWPVVVHCGSFLLVGVYPPLPEVGGYTFGYLVFGTTHPGSMGSWHGW